MTPLDGRSQGLLAGVGVAASLEEVEATGQAGEDLSGGEGLRSRGGEPDGERERAETGAELRDGLRWLQLRALAEERDGFRLGEWWDRVLDLAGDAQELAARREKSEVGAALEKGRE